MKTYKNLISIILLILVFSSCGHDSKAVDDGGNLKDYYSGIDYSCKNDSDCEIRDVGNCCGYYPACVRKDSKIDKSTIEEVCNTKQIGGVCGFPDITSCICSENKCRAPDGKVGNGL